MVGGEDGERGRHRRRTLRPAATARPGAGGSGQGPSSPGGRCLLGRAERGRVPDGVRSVGPELSPVRAGGLEAAPRPRITPGRERRPGLAAEIR